MAQTTKKTTKKEKTNPFLSQNTFNNGFYSATLCNKEQNYVSPEKIVDFGYGRTYHPECTCVNCRQVRQKIDHTRKLGGLPAFWHWWQGEQKRLIERREKAYRQEESYIKYEACKRTWDQWWSKQKEGNAELKPDKDGVIRKKVFIAISNDEDSQFWLSNLGFKWSMKGWGYNLETLPYDGEAKWLNHLGSAFCREMRPSVKNYKGKSGVYHATIELLPHESKKGQGWCTTMARFSSAYYDDNAVSFFVRKQRITSYRIGWFAALLANPLLEGKAKYRVVVGRKAAEKGRPKGMKL
jgi:hypothetical protein